MVVHNVVCPIIAFCSGRFQFLLFPLQILVLCLYLSSLIFLSFSLIHRLNNNDCFIFYFLKSVKLYFELLSRACRKSFYLYHLPTLKQFLTQNYIHIFSLSIIKNSIDTDTIRKGFSRNDPNLFTLLRT